MNTKKIKLLNIIFILLTSTFTFIPNVTAGTVITTKDTYNNYYFFLRRNDYSANDIKDFPKTFEQTVNHTVFDKLNIGAIVNPDEWGDILPLNYTKEQSSDKIDTYDDFYRKYIALANNLEGTVISKGYGKEIGLSCNTKYQVNGNNTYYLHGCWYDGEKWNNNSIDSYDPITFLPNPTSLDEKTKELTCASISPTTEISDVKVENGFLNVSITREEYNVTEIEFPKGMDFSTNVKGDSATNCGGKLIWYKTYDGSDGKDPTFSVLSPVLYKYSYDIVNNKCKQESLNGNLNCDNSASYENTCPSYTYTNDKVHNDISITQNHYVANEVTPNIIHQGGGISLGIELYSELSWKKADSSVDGAVGDVNGIEGIINNNLLKDTLDDINATIIIKNKNGETTLPAEKKCKVFDWNDKKITRKCTFYMPNYKLKNYSGIVELSNDTPSSRGVNNKYYTDLNYDGSYDISVKIENISMLDGDYDWIEDDTITIKNNDTNDNSCTIETIPMNDYIYRPIDLNNPFPNNRARGFNWIEYNTDRLTESYNYLQYEAVLNNNNIMNIKEYNEDNSYLDWTSINGNGDSKYITENKKIFTTKRTNIPEEGGS